VLEQLEAALLVGADLADVDLVEAGVDVAADGLEVRLGVGPTRPMWANTRRLTPR
jgi:hypothetical protein